MNNEQYQKNLEMCSKNKFLSKKYKHFYQGDIVSELLYQIVKKYVKDSILDIGAGTGALVQFLKNQKYNDVIGIDLYPKVEFIQTGSITNLKFNDNRFNTVFCTEVIEHLTDKQIDKGLSEVKRVLNKDGYFIATIPYDESLEKNTFTCPECGHKFHKVGHQQSFTKERIEKIFVEKGLKIEHICVYPLFIMSKLPLANLYWKFIMLFDKRFDFKKTILIVARLDI